MRLIIGKNNLESSSFSLWCHLHSFYRLNAVDTNRKELNELKCQERKMLKQTELIKSALNELGCEEVPSGCDISIDNQTFTISNSSEQVGGSFFILCECYSLYFIAYFSFSMENNI